MTTVADARLVNRRGQDRARIEEPRRLDVRRVSPHGKVWGVLSPEKNIRI